MLSRRQVAIIVSSGLLAALVVVVVGWFATPRESGTDGSFELTRPGVFVEPTPTIAPVGDPDDLLAVDGLVAADGRPVDLEIFRGGPVVINIWFIACPPCERELRDFAEVHSAYGDQIAFVGIDPFDSGEQMDEFAAERGVTYELVRDPEQRFVGTAGVTAYPTTLLLDADGTVVERVGAVDADQLAELIDRSFGVPAPDR